MNGFELLLLIATVAQTGNAPAASGPPETDFGWEVHADGVLEYIIQVSPDDLEMLTKHGKEKASAMPPELVGRATRIVVRIGSTVLPRTPTLEEIERRFPIFGSPASNANFPVTPPGLSAGNIKNVEPPTVYNVAGNNTPALPNALGNSIVPSRSLASDQSQKNGGQSGLPVIPSLNVPDSGILAQNSNAGSKLLDAARDSQATSRASAAVQNSDKFNSAPKQTPGQLPSAQSLGGARGSLTDPSNRDWTATTPPPSGNLPSASLPNALGTSALPGYGGQSAQTNSPGLYGGNNSQNLPSTPPSYGQATINSPAVAAERWPMGGQLVSQPNVLPGTQPAPQSPVSTFGNAPSLPGSSPAYGPNAYGSPVNYSGNQAGYAQSQSYQDSQYQGQQSTFPPASYPSTSGNAGQLPRDPQYSSDPRYSRDPRYSSDPQYSSDPRGIGRVAMNTSSTPNDLPSSTMARSGESAPGRWEAENYDNRRPAPTNSAGLQGAPEPAKSADGILQVFFLLSLVVNFYLGLLIRRLLARYRSLLSSVRSETA